MMLLGNINAIPFRRRLGGGDDIPFPNIPGMIARYSALGLTNEQMAENPVWKDLTGNGHDLQMKNFAWGGMSGVGGYSDNFSSDSWKKPSDRSDITWTSSSFNITRVMNTGVQMYYQAAWEESESVIPEKRIIVKGLEDGQVLRYMNVGNRIIGISQDGIYTIPSFIFKGVSSYYGYSLAKKQESCDITIEQLPFYPGFILGDGVDDYAITEKELNFEDTYTVYTAFIPFQDDPTRTMALCGKDRMKDFYLYYSSLDSVGFFSADKSVSVLLNKGFNLIASKRTSDKMVIKNIITGKSSEISANILIDNPGLYYLWRSATITNYAKAAIAGQTICNGYFSTDEDDEKVLDWYKKQYPWLFPDQAWTVTGKTNEDEDRATIHNITGNGNDLLLSNFGFAKGSGYGLYNIQKFTNWNHVADRGDIVKNGYSVTITNSKITGSSTNYNTDILYSYNSSSTTIIFKVTGLVDGQKIFLGRKSVTDAYVIDKDGIYRSDYNIPQEDGKVIVGIGTVGFTGECNITIEQILEYEGYLVTDGVDDKVQSSSFTMNEDWTIVGDWELLSNVQINCGIVKAQNVYLYNTANGLLISINNSRSLQSFGTKSLHAICSDGRLYDRNWVEYEYTVDQNFEIVKSSLNIGFNLNNYTQIAFKNLGIYNNQILSKDDCIKAYNYLQTLKAK